MPLTAHSNISPYPEQPSREPHCSRFLKLKDDQCTVRPQHSPCCPWTPCATWGLGLKIKQHPLKLSSRTAKFQNPIFQVLRRTWSHNAAPHSSAFCLWQDTKTTMHFADIPTATKAQTQLRKVKLYTWVPPPPASTTTFLSWPFCVAQKKIIHITFWTDYIYSPAHLMFHFEMQISLPLC